MFPRYTTRRRLKIHANINSKTHLLLRVRKHFSLHNKMNPMRSVICLFFFVLYMCIEQEIVSRERQSLFHQVQHRQHLYVPQTTRAF